MAITISRIQPCLWFDDQAQQAAQFYVDIFPDSALGAVSYFSEVGQEFHQRPPGSVMTVAFDLFGQRFTALNGGPIFKFSEAISLQVICDTQQQIDHYWSRLNEGGDPAAQQCGWLKDRFGLSWQIVPSAMQGWMTGDPAATQRVMAALFTMKKLDIAILQRAYDGA